MGAVRLNINGMTFGRLTAIAYVENSNGNRWTFLCECGNIVERRAKDVKHSIAVNAIASCGCVRNVTLDTNKTYGKLTPIKKLNKRQRGYDWEFLCECGKHVIKNGSQVLRGQGALHCGCTNNSTRGQYKIDLLHQRYGALLVISADGCTITGHRKWMCKCDCGKILSIRAFYLRRGKTDCGCRIAKTVHNTCFTGIGELYRSHWSKIQHGAKIRNIEFNITIEHAWDLFLLQDRKCALSGELLILGKYGVKTASLDRINNKLGYIVGNIQWVHKTINTAKWASSNEDFITMCRRVHEYNRNVK